MYYFMELDKVILQSERTNLVNVDLGKIVKNLKTNEEIRWYCQLNCNFVFNYNLFSTLLSSFQMLRHWLSFSIRLRNKRSKLFSLFYIKFLTLKEAQPVWLPHFKMCEELTKAYIVTKCRTDKDINFYIPDKDNINELSRDFLLMVSFILTSF